MEDYGTNLCYVAEKSEEIDYFDQLPDPIIVMIFDKVYDARSLCRCLAVSKRFNSLVSEVGSVCISMNCSNSKKPIDDLSKSRSGSKNFFKNFVCKFLTKPLNFLQQNNKKLFNSSSSNNFGSGIDIFKWVNEILKNFNDVESVFLELPCHGGEIGVNKNTPLLKWEASFGEVMDGCVILGANSVSQSKNGSNRRSGMSFRSCNEGSHENGEGDEDEDDDYMFSDEELRLRIIWIISCLIASSGRHNLMKKMVGQCPKLSNVVISDAGRQGKLHMNGAQIQELRSSMIISANHINKVDLSPSAGPEPAEVGPGPAAVGSEGLPASQVGYVGNLVMKMWYVKELELPKSGQVMKGATLVVIKPENRVERSKVSMWGGFEGDKVFEEASKELLKRKEKRVYRLEVNSF
ncbi:hypothetical protein RND81_04G240900 [Saponaria officinalis]|uniref:F-box domain-containing protein n=1 Tax=Saponaria officinalis TaxID=3572 RepID=A0AAW1LPZ6_SAPOF